MIKKHRKFITLHISNFILIHNSGSIIGNPNTINCSHIKRVIFSKSDIGWNPNRPIFHERSGSRDEHEEHEGKHEGKTQRGMMTHKYRGSIICVTVLVGWSDPLFPSCFLLMFVVFITRFAPFVKDRPSRVPPYIILVSRATLITILEPPICVF